MQITVINQQKIVPINRRKAKKTVLDTLKLLKISSFGQLSVVYVDDSLIKKVNYRFLGKDCPTDVLCFDLSQGKEQRADIMISTETALRNAARFKALPQTEIKRYLIHAILHLCGFNDGNRKDRQRMQRKERAILKKV